MLSILILPLVMVIGFTERRRTVSESDDSLRLFINVITLRVSEREYRMLYRVLPSGTATVVSFVNFNMIDFDARFGASEADPIEQLDVLLPGQDFIIPMPVQIINDIVPEDEECFSIQISPINIPGLRELFMCDFVDNTIPLNIFCEHTICIEDDDGKVVLYPYTIDKWPTL